MFQNITQIVKNELFFFIISNAEKIMPLSYSKKNYQHYQEE